MKQSKHNITVGDREQRYRVPETKVIFVNTHGVLCQSPGDQSMREYDFGDGGFIEGY